MSETPGPISRMRREVIGRLLEEVDFALLVVNPACPGVCLPEDLIRAGAPVALNLGWRLPLPIPDLRLEEDGISGTLSFQQSPFFCKLPWPSIVQVSVGEEHLVWITPELARQPEAKPIRLTPRLRLVD